MDDEAAPGGFIKAFGYLIIASSAGGNVVCLHSLTGGVYWADHESFASGSIDFKDRSTGRWEHFDNYTPDNVRRAMVALSESLEPFLMDLLSDRLRARLYAVR